MTVEIKFPKYDGDRVYLTWRPVEVTIRFLGPQGSPNLPVTIAAKTTATGGRLAFATTLTHLGSRDIGVTLPGNGAPVRVWIGGMQPSPNGTSPTASTTYGDVSVEVRSATGEVLAAQKVMVRVRKNANKLTPLERGRFLNALARLNGSGQGRYREFRDMHVEGLPREEAHGGAGFLPWHRAYILDFERELQMIDPEVTLPYWRFEEAAPNLFSPSFLGVSDGNRVQFAADNPLRGWIAFGAAGIDRGKGIGPQTVLQLMKEKETLGSGGILRRTYTEFKEIESNAHASAHNGSDGGWIMAHGTAPRDPLFFLLHCNVDRLWARWQHAAGVHNPDDQRAFDEVADPRPGHRLDGALWPWCGPRQAGRPQDAPGEGLQPSPMTDAPGPSPVVRQMIDYLGTASAQHLGFAYDDVPFRK
jgi:tyrosinase